MKSPAATKMMSPETAISIASVMVPTSSGTRMSAAKTGFVRNAAAITVKNVKYVRKRIIEVFISAALPQVLGRFVRTIASNQDRSNSNSPSCPGMVE